MKFNFPITVDMCEFIRSGRFDYIEIGQSDEAILQMFPDPDCVSGGLVVKKGWNIWLYGNVEFHFSDGRLNQIRVENLAFEGVHGGRSIMLRPWIFAQTEQLNLNEVLGALIRQHIDFIKTEEKAAVVLRLQSGVDLVFEKDGVQRLQALCKGKAKLPQWVAEAV
ncbi:hypothetical protein [Neisseria perflava]|uniref:hypothetical protein n=1 Tax=Neisseria perflava TaxID=33053 RepID=UPI00209FF099|nr:hypothetical protein [Neisseria perflava]MCP1659665.1 hypothetical protein [Neisseria perflava]MCP1771315.1 hypothetical protein [Neisseria perflava]